MFPAGHKHVAIVRKDNRYDAYGNRVQTWTAGILSEAFRAYAGKNCATWAIGVFFNHRILTPFRL